MARSVKKQRIASTTASTAAGPAKSPQPSPADGKGDKAKAGSKQPRVIAMLQSPAGASPARDNV